MEPQVSSRKVPQRPYTARPASKKLRGKRPRSAFCTARVVRQPQSQPFETFRRHDLLQKRLIIQAAVLAKRHRIISLAAPVGNQEDFDPDPNAAEYTRTVIQAFKPEDEYLRYANAAQLSGDDWCFSQRSSTREEGEDPHFVGSRNAEEGRENVKHSEAGTHVAGLFEAVSRHTNTSVLLNNTAAKQQPLPDRFSSLKVLEMLKHIGEIYPELSRLTDTMLAILIPTIYDTEVHTYTTNEAAGYGNDGAASYLRELAEANIKTYWERAQELEEEVAALRARAEQAEAELETLREREQGKSVDDLLSQLVSTIQATDDLLFKQTAVAKLVQQLDLSFDRKWFCSLFPGAGLLDVALHCVGQVCDPESLLGVVQEALRQADGSQILCALFERDPELERRCLLEQRPSRLQAFWERHSDALYSLLWTSSELVDNMMLRRPEVYGKVLQAYLHSVKTERGASRAWTLHRTVIQGILSGVARHDASFIHGLFLENVDAVRSFLEKSVEKGQEVVRDLACTSRAMVDTTVTASPDLLASVLADRTAWLAEMAKENPVFLLNLGREHPDVFGSVFSLDHSVLPSIARMKPSILHPLAIHEPDALVACLQEEPSLIFSALALAAEDDVVGGFQEQPDLLVHNGHLLDRLGLVNVEDYRSKCHDAEVQTMVIQSTAKSIKPQALVDMIGRKRLKNGTAGEHEDLLRLIANVYEAKVKCDLIDIKAGHPLDPLPEVLSDYISEHVKAKDIHLTPKRALVNVATTVRKFAGVDESVHWFGVMIGVVNPDTFNPQSYTFFFSILNQLLPHDQYHACLQQMQNVWLPLSKISQAVLDAMDSLWNDQDAKRTIFKQLNRLPRAEANRSDLRHGWCVSEVVRMAHPDGNGASASPSKSAASRVSLKAIAKKSMFQVLKEAKMSAHNPTVECVRMHEAMSLVMRCWAEADEAIVKRLIDLYTLADTNGDGILDIDEFKALVLMVDPTVQERTVRRLFKVTGKSVDGEAHEQSILPMDFVEVMRSQNINFASLPSSEKH